MKNFIQNIGEKGIMTILNAYTLVNIDIFSNSKKKNQINNNA